MNKKPERKKEESYWSFWRINILDRRMSKCKGPESGSNLTYSMNIEEINLASAVRSGRGPLRSYSLLSTANMIQKISCLNLIFFSFEFNRRLSESFEQGMT